VKVLDIFNRNFSVGKLHLCVGVLQLPVPQRPQLL